MHMADALVSPAVGGTMWAVTTGLIGFSSAKVNRLADDRTIPFMGVLGAFVFAAQMINFAIPGTGSSGHLGGGLLLAILLGPWAALLTLASILTIQALFFADGGILALGCNIFNMGSFPACWPTPFSINRLPDPGRTAAGSFSRRSWPRSPACNWAPSALSCKRPCPGSRTCRLPLLPCSCSRSTWPLA